MKSGAVVWVFFLLSVDLLIAVIKVLDGGVRAWPLFFTAVMSAAAAAASPLFNMAGVISRRASLQTRPWPGVQN